MKTRADSFLGRQIKRKQDPEEKEKPARSS